MLTELLPCNPPASRPVSIGRAVTLLRRGMTVAVPTETVYGLAADAMSADAVARIFEAKDRPHFDPLIVHIADQGWLATVARPSGDADMDVLGRLAAAFWPGPLTLVVPRSADIPDIAASGLPSVAVRCPAHPIFREVLAAFGRPLAAPSANRFGRISPTSAAHVREELGGRISAILDGGPTQHGLESTIVRIGVDGLDILREGPITREQLAEFAAIQTLPTGESGASPGDALQAPGLTESHYAPQTPLTIFDGEAALDSVPDDARVGVIEWSGEARRVLGSRVVTRIHLSPSHNLREAAACLFAALRELDGSGATHLVADPVPEKGVGRAIMQRLRKAAAKRPS